MSKAIAKKRIPLIEWGIRQATLGSCEQGQNVLTHIRACLAKGIVDDDALFDSAPQSVKDTFLRHARKPEEPKNVAVAAENVYNLTRLLERAKDMKLTATVAEVEATIARESAALEKMRPKRVARAYFSRDRWGNYQTWAEYGPVPTKKKT